jgi:hypothetical protein
MALVSTQPVIETSTRNLSGSKEWPATSHQPVSRLSTKCGNLDVSQLHGFSRLITRIALPLFLPLPLTLPPPAFYRMSSRAPNCGREDPGFNSRSKASESSFCGFPYSH